MPERTRFTRLSRALPYSALAGAIVVIVALVSASGLRQAMLRDTGQTLPVVEATVAGLQALHPAAVNEATFLAAVSRAAESQYVATIWLFAPDGRIVYSAGSTRSSGTAQDRATAETRRILSALPAGTLDDRQTLSLLAASAIQAEGEHNDVYRHLVRPVRAPGGALAGLIGVAYDVSPGIGGRPDLPYLLAVLAVPLGLALYWLSLPAWVYLDARRRGDRAWAWAAFVLVGNLAALLAYILSRPNPFPPPSAA